MRWRRTRQVLQAAAGVAMLAQWEGPALVIGGLAMLVQSMEERRAAGLPIVKVRPPGGVSARGRLPLKVVNGLADEFGPIVE